MSHRPGGRELIEVMAASSMRGLFFIVMSNGEKLHVPHQDFIWIMPNGKVVMVALPSGASRWVNIHLIAGIEKPAPSKKSSRKR